ncbi:MAG: ABC transporter substrate-binding protein [Anaerolineales bacterium]
MIKRTRYAPALMVLSIVLILSACGGGGNKVEVFPFWTGNDVKSFDALVNSFQEAYPDIQFVNGALGIGPGVDTHFVLNTLIKAGETPDSWQGIAGKTLTDEYARSGQIQPLNDLYEAEGWFNAMPKNLIPLISEDDSIYSVPINVHRTNVLWYNPAILDANGIAVPKNMNEWFLAMDSISAAGFTPLAIGDQSTKMILFETVLLSNLGSIKYNSLWTGTVSWGGDEVQNALEDYQRLLTFIDKGTDALSWQEAAELVASGKAAFIVMDDRANGYFLERGKAPTVDYNWAPVPGTDGAFQFYSDSFVLAEDALNEKNARTWLAFVGSQKGQETFNVKAGTMCARVDCDPSLFDKYVQSSMASWPNDALAGSLSYGMVANARWKSEIDAALTTFLQNGELGAFQDALVAACKNAGPCR